MAEGGGGEVVLTDLEDGKEQKVEEVERKESKGGFTLGAEDGEELLGEMEFTMRHTQPTPFKVVAQKRPTLLLLVFSAGRSRLRACHFVRRSVQGGRSSSWPLGWPAFRYIVLSKVGINRSLRVISAVASNDDSKSLCYSQVKSDF